MNEIQQLFKDEALEDAYFRLSDGMNFMYSENFLKESREFTVPDKTVIFGKQNRLNLIKNKMKHNPSFSLNAECVDTKDIPTWVRVTDEYIEAHSEVDVLKEEIVLVPDNEPTVIEEGTPSSNITEVEDIVEVIDETQHNIPKFKFGYYGAPKPISRISSGFSIYDINIEEVKTNLIKKLNNN